GRPDHSCAACGVRGFWHSLESAALRKRSEGARVILVRLARSLLQFEERMKSGKPFAALYLYLCLCLTALVASACGRADLPGLSGYDTLTPIDGGPPPSCGDKVCGSGENPRNCPDDCRCGDGVCSQGESNATCPNDCPVKPPTCGNGSCEPGENSSNCPT